MTTGPTADGRVERALLRITFWAHVVTAALLLIVLVTMAVHVLTGHRDPILETVIGNG